MKTKTTTTNKEVIALIEKAFDKQGMLINPNSRKNQNQAKGFLESDYSYYGEKVNGYDTHTCLLIIAYPNRDI
jgi:hypothetical protein